MEEPAPPEAQEPQTAPETTTETQEASYLPPPADTTEAAQQPPKTRRRTLVRTGDVCLSARFPPLTTQTKEKILWKPQFKSSTNHEYRSFPMAQLQESTTNPRKRFDAKSLEELAAYVPGHISCLLCRWSFCGGGRENSAWDLVVASRRDT